MHPSQHLGVFQAHRSKWTVVVKREEQAGSGDVSFLKRGVRRNPSGNLVMTRQQLLVVNHKPQCAQGPFKAGVWRAALLTLHAFCQLLWVAFGQNVRRGTGRFSPINGSHTFIHQALSSQIIRSVKNTDTSHSIFFSFLFTRVTLLVQDLKASILS